MTSQQSMSRPKQPSVGAVCIGINAKQINETLDSLELVSDYLNEVIIIDSTEGNEVKIPGKLRPIGKKIKQLPARGISNAFNSGVQEANSEYLVFYNGGDLCVEAGFIKSMEIIIANPRIIIVAGDVILKSSTREKLWKPRFENGRIFQIHHIGTIYRKELHQENGLYDPMMKCAMDYSFLRRAVKSLEENQIKLTNKVCGIFVMGGVSSVMSERKHIEVLASDLLTERGLLKALIAYCKSALGSRLRKYSEPRS